MDAIVSTLAKRIFSRAMNFPEKRRPLPPECTRRIPRLLYLHIPFCERLCPYCSFNRVVFDKPLCRSYFAALRKEIRLYRDQGFDFSSLYVGGGTPTIMIDELQQTIALVRELFSIREISVETNPNHLCGEMIDALKDMKIDRLSVGVQSFQDDLLRQMDRYDKYGGGGEIASRLKEVKGEFTTLNADMIFNFPSQSAGMLRRDLAVLEEIAIDQVTYYPLMASDYTRQAMDRKIGRVSYDRQRALYRLIVSSLLPRYRLSSVWCFSREKTGRMIDEYIVDYDEYAGLGSGAIGYLEGRCYANSFSIPEYIDALARGRLPLFASRDFSLPERMGYDLLMKFFGMKAAGAALFRKDNRAAHPGLAAALGAFTLLGFLRYRDGAFHLTRRGAYLWLTMMREFFAAVNNFRDYCRQGQATAEGAQIPAPRKGTTNEGTGEG